LAALEDLKPKTRVTGLVAGGPATVIAVDWHGNDTVEVVYRTDDGQVADRLLSRSDEPRLQVEVESTLWTLDADGDLFRLASEARRIELAHLFDPYVAVDTSTIEPLPHQIEAVYEDMLPRQPLRYLLADDPGAGKTIMSGLYVRELIIRGDVDRCLVVAPGSLVEQWQDELWQKFQLDFRILSWDMINAARTGNPFMEQSRLIVRIDQLARNEDLQAKVSASDWDLVIVDEAHKMSAHYYGNELTKTKRYQVGELLREKTRHLLLLTATPHNGKDEDFQLFMSLLDPDRFAGRLRGHEQPADARDLMRRYVKERLLTFNGTRLFPERRSTTVRYELSAPEMGLYRAVTHYVREGMNRAQRLEEGGDRKRGLVVGFALTALQRRLASSPEAIYRSIQRRKERLHKRLVDLESLDDDALRIGRLSVTELPTGVTAAALEEFDADDYDDSEREDLEEAAIDQATAAATMAELRAEIDELETLERLAAQVRGAGTDKKWEELRSILLSDEMTAGVGVKRKLIVFSEHRDTLHYLEARIRSLVGRHKSVVTIHGNMKREDRRRAQDLFIHDPEVQILVATDAAGEGVNLQRANLMVNYDLPWNPNRIEQRFGRIHRIGQSEVCHLWNLLAEGTREGAVFDRLFKKIEEQKKVFGDQIYDVLGDSQINRSLRDLLIEAIRYGERPEAKKHLEEVIDDEIGRRFEEVINERALTSDLLSAVRVEEIREQMERAKARKLLPGFVEAFFREAFRSLGGRVVEREKGRFEITRVPAAVRSRERELAVGAPLQSRYERVTFEKELVHVDGKPVAELLAPGHPLLVAVIDTVLERHGGLLRQGTVFVDPDDPTETPKALVYLEHAIHDGRPTAQGKRIVSRRYQFVEIDDDGTTNDAGHAPYLDYRPVLSDEREHVGNLLQAEWISRTLNDSARSYAVANLAGPHFAEMRGITEARVARVRRAVEERLKSEIAYWDGRAAELKRQELAGKKPRLNSGRARQRADELEARLERRMRELDQELDLSNLPPTVVGGALVIPQGLLDRLAGTRTKTPADHAKEVDEIDRRAIAAVMAAEESIGRDPVEMDHGNPGYDIESTDPETGAIYFIEVKGRLEGEKTVTVKARQIRQAKNNPETFRLAIAVVPREESEQPTVHYLVRPFQGHELHFAAVSETFDLAKLLDRAQGPV
jgi:SNF2 family DNA or RNA helicase